jgi:hypothetical protein
MKRNETKRNETKRNETKYNETKRKMKKRNETKRNEFGRHITDHLQVELYLCKLFSHRGLLSAITCFNIRTSIAVYR